MKSDMLLAYSCKERKHRFLEQNDDNDDMFAKNTTNKVKEGTIVE